MFPTRPTDYIHVVVSLRERGCSYTPTLIRYHSTPQANRTFPSPSGGGPGRGERFRMKHLARKLRRQSTDAEKLLWHHLRAHRMAGFKFRRQYIIEPYIVDFVCLEARLIIEADGGQHALIQDRDASRTKYLEQLGYSVIRFWNHEILNNTHAVLSLIHQNLTTPR